MREPLKKSEPCKEPSQSAQFNEDLACDVCGVYGVYQFGDRKLCQSCYEGSGSCCPEFGKDDLWEKQNLV